MPRSHRAGRKNQLRRLSRLLREFLQEPDLDNLLLEVKENLAVNSVNPTDSEAIHGLTEAEEIQGIPLKPIAWKLYLIEK